MSEITGFSNKLRFGGLASGLDTDSIVKQLMKAESASVNKVKQKKQRLEWQRDNYRDMTNLLRGLKDEFFNALKPLNNMNSSSVYSKFTTNSTETSVATATAGSEAIATSHDLTVNSLAKAANVIGTSVTKSLTGNAIPAGAINLGANNKFQVTVDGITKTIDLQAAYAGIGDLTTDLNAKLTSAFGAGKIGVTDNGTSLTFASPANTNKITLTSYTGADALGTLGFSSNASNRLNIYDQISVIKDQLGTPLANGDINFNINNVDFTITQTETLADLMNKVNGSSAGVEIKYSEATDQFTITAKQKGTGDTIHIVNGTNNFFGAGGSAKIDAIGNETSVNNGKVTAGFDLSVTLDGANLTRSDNTFTVDGVTYTITATDPALLPKSTKITVNKDVDGIFNTIKGFVDKYNEVITKLYAEVSEKKNRDFLPLTEEQKKEMTEDDIKNWEEKAKSGLLQDDPLIKKVINDLRGTLFSPITGVNGTIDDIGINTSSWFDKGKLVINETKLKDAIQNSPDKVNNFLNKTSSIAYSPNLSAADRKTRYDESGIMKRISDVIEDNIRTTRSASGQKGTLLEKAGLVGDISEFSNTIYNEIKKQDRTIDTLLDKLAKKETNYYKRFAALEKAINKMNSQSSWLSQQFSG